MRKKIKSFLDENRDLIHEELQNAAEASVDIAEVCSRGDNKISVVLTDDYEIRVLEHHASYNYTTDIIYVIATFNCETCLIEYEDIINHLDEDLTREFHQSIVDAGVEYIEV